MKKYLFTLTSAAVALTLGGCSDVKVEALMRGRGFPITN